MQFDFFLKFATEQAVEDILTTYTQENKSASVFLGAKKAKKKKEPEKVANEQSKPVNNQANDNQPAEEKKEQKVYRQRQVARDQMPTHQRRAMSQERQPKLLTERSGVDRSPFERSVRGAAYIYTTKPSSSSNSQTSRQASTG